MVCLPLAILLTPPPPLATWTDRTLPSTSGFVAALTVLL